MQRRNLQSVPALQPSHFSQSSLRKHPMHWPQRETGTLDIADVEDPEQFERVSDDPNRSKPI